MSPKTVDNEVLTVEEAAKLLRVNRNSLYLGIKKGTIPGVMRIGRVIRLNRRRLLDWATASEG